MGKLSWTPWHQVVTLRDDVRSGDLALHMFAADLYEVKRGKARPVYQDPKEFFALTYPTRNLRELVKDVVYRLAGKNDKAVRQLELTYGGGKTHTLITLLHMVSDPGNLPDLPAVHEFRAALDGLVPPNTRVVVLPFDKLDVEKGMEIPDPQGNVRRLKEPWSVLAWQLAGEAGLKHIHPDDKAEERETAPAEPLMVDLLSWPQKDGLATLVLLDEVLMYARDKINKQQPYEGYLESFFQFLTQAATKIERCAVVASLLATDPKKMDQTGQRIVGNFSDIFRRGQEESVQPVEKQDVAEVLRRRFFTSKSIQNKDSFKPHVLAALKGICDLDEQTKKEGGKAEERFLSSYPFHPDVTEVLYSKWTSMQRFQRTRGVLRTFALALRDAAKWDQSPLVGINVFLTAPGQTDLAEALRELTSVASTEEYEGKRQEWAQILQGELQKAEEIQRETTAINYREVEQAVLATFLHSQPVGQKAQTRDLTVLLGTTRPDKIELEKALKQWADTSWFLDEECLSDADAGSSGERLLPKIWRLGGKPNLKQMHADAAQNRVSDALVEQQLLQFIGETKSLTQGASAAGARVHTLPSKPNDVDDDGDFHFAILGPKAASASGNPSAEAQRFINETTASDRPRVYRNAVVLAVPDKGALDAARNQVREYLGWLDVQQTLKEQDIDPLRSARLHGYIQESKNKLPEAIRQAYSIVVTVNEKDAINAFKITVAADPLFTIIKNDVRSRIQDTAVEADALLPGGPYNLWQGNETERPVKDLAGAFAQHPHLPKMLRHSEILSTLAAGAEQGSFVLRARRPDGSLRTFWMQRPTDAEMKDPSLELVLSEAAALTEIASDLLRPKRLPSLWPQDGEMSFKSVCDYFSGTNVVQIDKGGYMEPLTIPKADRDRAAEAVADAVKDGVMWLVAGPASIWKESIPAGVLTDRAELLPPPKPVPATEVLRESLSDAWQAAETTAIAIYNALSNKYGKALPWTLVRSAIDDALRGHYLERTEDSGPWPCELAGASSTKLRVAEGKPLPVPEPHPAPGARVARASLKPNALQDLADQIGDITKLAAGYGLDITVRIELGADSAPDEDVIARVNEILGEINEDFTLK